MEETANIYSRIKDFIKKNFSPLEIKIGLIVILGFIAYFIGRKIGIIHSHIINAR
ncbi:MAG: hypothetical protein GX335_10575 [Firmicutes bacterium]|nr:hypothetical protein [Bacillota bacterium]